MKQSDEASSVELDIHKHRNLSGHLTDSLMPEKTIMISKGDSSRNVEAWKNNVRDGPNVWTYQAPLLLLDEEFSADCLCFQEPLVIEC